MEKATALCGSGQLSRAASITSQGRYTGLVLVQSAASPPAAFQFLSLAMELGTHDATIAFTLLVQK